MPQRREAPEQVEYVRKQTFGEWSCSRCGMDIELGQSYREEGGKMHAVCPKRRR